MSVVHPTAAGHGRDLPSSSSSGQQPAGPIAEGAAGGKRPGRALAGRPDVPPTRRSFTYADQSQQTSRNYSRSGLTVEGQQVGEPLVGASYIHPQNGYEKRGKSCSSPLSAILVMAPRHLPKPCRCQIPFLVLRLFANTLQRHR